MQKTNIRCYMHGSIFYFQIIMKNCLFWFYALLSNLCCGQICESFTCRDSLKHCWFGDTAYFFPEGGMLRLEGPQESSTLYFATQNNLCDSTEWNFEVELGFNPSSTNFVRIYLMSDVDDLKSPLNGYFVQLGQSGGKNNIQIFRQQGTFSTLIFSGFSMFNAAKGLAVRVRIKRLSNSVWQVFSGVPGAYSWKQEGEPFVDSMFQKTVAFGFYCRYSTSTRYDRYAFGDVKVCAVEPDVLPEPPVVIEDSDVVISEILFDPLENSAEYMEIYNRSGQVLNAADLYLGTFDAQNRLSKRLVISEFPNIVILPKTYAVLSKKPALLQSNHNLCEDSQFIEMQNFPSLSNLSGHFALLRNDSSIIDEILYHSSMHYALLTETKGVSLERLNLGKSGMEANNWHSASENAGFSTPGCPNSQEFIEQEVDDLFQIFPLLISPDNDGMDDVLLISYRMKDPGFKANIRIFDSFGRQVRHLVKSELLGLQGNYYWDGLSEQSTKLPCGVYIIVFDIFSLDGRVQRVKKMVGYR